MPQVSRRTSFGFGAGVCAAALLTLAGAPASGQTQDGRGLDRSLYRPLDAIPGQANLPSARRSFADEVRFRNAIVTGDVPGGAAFRGDVGYTAPFAFRGELGSDDSFAFRRDSFYSGLGGTGIRGTDALQYQFALTTGGTVPQGLASRLTFERPGASGAAGSLAASGFASPSFTSTGWGVRDDAGFTGTPVNVRRPGDLSVTGEFPARPGGALDTINTGAIGTTSAVTSQPGSLAAGYTPPSVSSLSTLRSTAAFQSVQTLRPELMGYTDGGNQRLLASGLSGVVLQDQLAMRTAQGAASASGVRPADNRFGAAQSALGARPGEVAQADTDASSRSTTAYEQILDRLRTATGAQAAVPAGAQGAGAASAVARPTTAPLPSLATPEQPQPAPVEPWRERLNELQTQLAEIEQREAWSARGVRVPSREGDTEEGDDGRVRYRFDPETMRMIRDAGGRVTSYAAVGTDRDAYAEQLAAAQRLMSEGRFFDAEERFTRAIALRPGEVTARIGRVHAQMGAGLILSAGVNLRALLREHPEVATTRYDAALLPSSSRLEEVAVFLGSALQSGGDLTREAALLIAYLGYQSGNRSLLEGGLNAMRADTFTDGAGEAQPKAPDPLADLLEALWLAEAPAP